MHEIRAGKSLFKKKIEFRLRIIFGDVLVTWRSVLSKKIKLQERSVYRKKKSLYISYQGKHFTSFCTQYYDIL